LRSLAGGGKGRRGYFTAEETMACGETVCTRGERRAPFIGVGGAEGLHERHLEGRAGEFKARCAAADPHSRHRRHWRAGVWPERRKMATHEEEHETTRNFRERNPES
jgi:hypothetical protein